MKKLTVILLGAILFLSCSREEVATISQFELLETINDLEDSKEYLLWDIENGKYDQTLGQTNVQILDHQIDKLKSKLR
tara:strand:+ start:723 stop:956 length:234 start_codon:yes stop_codon:yes gene_type:complete